MNTQRRLEMNAQDTAIIHQTSGCTVVRIDECTVIKRGTRVALDEKSALELAKYHKLPVPRIIEAQRNPVNGEGILRMECMPGVRLDSIWPTMTTEEKDNICQQLREILTTMRSISSGHNNIGSCSGGVARDCRQYTTYEGGPFLDETQFNLFLFDLVPTVPNSIRVALQQQHRNDHRIVFSHGDIAQQNILVENGRITGLLDWEYAGWYPEYWDYVKFFDRPCKYKDWKDCAEKIFPSAYYKELALHQAMIRWQRP